MGLQKTLQHSISLQGIGLHSGKQIHLTLHPAADHHGIVFCRTHTRLGTQTSTLIPALAQNVVRTDLSTTLGQQGVTISTVEHLMAALVGAGLHNVLIEVSGPEIPILDGSSQIFLDAIQAAGTIEGAQKQKKMILKKTIFIQSGEKWILAKPASEFNLTTSIAFQHPLIGQQTFMLNGGDSFQHIASARTFGFLKEVEYMRQKGLALGGSLDNAVVLNDQSVMNPEGLRYPDEFVRHKALDAYGDLGLMGMPLVASIHAHKSGHELHVQLMKEILSTAENYEICTMTSPETVEETACLQIVPVLSTAY